MLIVTQVLSLLCGCVCVRVCVYVYVNRVVSDKLMNQLRQGGSEHPTSDYRCVCVAV